MKFILRIRHEVQSNLATVWIIQKDKGVSQGRLHGVMPIDSAERLAEALQLPVERTAFEGERHDEPRPETVMQTQGELFAEAT